MNAEQFKQFKALRAAGVTIRKASVRVGLKGELYMFSPATESQCRLAIQAEYHKAKKEHGDFGSLHEGWAVMREEWEETFEEVTGAAADLNAMWERVKRDDVACSLNAAREIQTHALAAMIEAAQLAAMARKMIDYCNEVLCE